MLITLSGLDGAGKSTLAESLRAELEAGPRRAVVLHLNDHVGVYAYLRALRNRVAGGPSPDAPPRMTPRATRLGRTRDAVLWSKGLRQIVYLVDLLIFLVYRGVLEHLGGRVLIMDRYFYDTLVDVGGRGVGGWTRVLAHLTPRPDVPVLLDIAPEMAFARKGEYTVEYLRDREAGYRRVFAGVSAPLRLSACDLNQARHWLVRVVRTRLAHDVHDRA